MSAAAIIDPTEVGTFRRGGGTFTNSLSGLFDSVSSFSLVHSAPCENDDISIRLASSNNAVTLENEVRRPPKENFDAVCYKLKCN